MFYYCYLSNVCQRRSWPDPLYEFYRSGTGYLCKVRVNNREYCTDVPYESEELAQNGAAMKAYMICRNFSHNDGMYPGQRPGQTSPNGIIQGLPVAIGAGRRSNRNSAGSYTEAGSSDGSSGGSSGGASPKSISGGFEQQLMISVTQQLPRAAPSAAATTVAAAAAHKTPKQDVYLCYCRRAPVRAYGRCSYCLAASGWA